MPRTCENGHASYFGHCRNPSYGLIVGDHQSAICDADSSRIFRVHLNSARIFLSFLSRETENVDKSRREAYILLARPYALSRPTALSPSRPPHCLTA